MSKGRIDLKSDSVDVPLVPECVAAIELGTIYSGYGFSLKCDYEASPTKINLQQWSADSTSPSYKTSTCVLFTPDEGFHKFGFEAEKTYRKLQQDIIDYKKWYFFRRFKLETLQRSSEIVDITGKTMQATKVIGECIRFMVDRVKASLMHVRPDNLFEKTRFVMTIPGGSTLETKWFMEEAANLAGITQERLLVVKASDAVSVFCKNVPLGQTKTTAQLFNAGSRNVILDVGGDTVKAAVCEVQTNSRLKEIYHTKWDFCGGTAVDTCFEGFLQKLAGAEVFTIFKTSFFGDYIDTFDSFEKMKREIRKDREHGVPARLSESLCTLFGEKNRLSFKDSVKRGQYGKAGQVTLEGNLLRVNKTQCLTFIEPVAKDIGNRLDELMQQKLCEGANTVFLVGGFSQAPVLQEYIKERFKSKHIVVPQSGVTAAITGSVIIGHDPDFKVEESVLDFPTEEFVSTSESSTKIGETISKRTPRKAKEVEQSTDKSAETPVRRSGPFIVGAIDFGTTFSGYAFSFWDRYTKNPTHVQTHVWSTTNALMSQKTSTCVLFEPDQTFKHFGFDAEEHYADLVEQGVHKDWYYFRRFKMELFDKKKLKMTFVVKDETGKPMEAVKVFGSCIAYLKKHMMKKIRNSFPEACEADIRYVITVPAIWNEGAKLFMKEAAKVAGIKSDQLMIALEPEVPSICCKHLAISSFSGTGMSPNFKPFDVGAKYIILDAGGGTIDITVHEVNADRNLRELFRANGGAWGGTYVDKCFEDFLRELLGDEVIDEFKEDCVDAYLCFFKGFEVKKKDVREDMRDTSTYTLDAQIPIIFKEKNKEKIEDAINNNETYGKTGMVKWMGRNKINMKKEVYFKFFEPALNYIGDHMEAMMKDMDSKDVGTILMVGGFSESHMLQDYIRERFSKMRVIVPDDPGPGLVVLTGAVIYGFDPSAICERKCRFTYGIEENGLFDVHVKKNTLVKCGEYENGKEYIPSSDADTSYTFSLWASEQECPKSVTDEGCFHLGDLKIELPHGSTREDKRIKLSLRCGTVNVEATATAVKTGQSVTSAFALPS